MNTVNRRMKFKVSLDGTGSDTFTLEDYLNYRNWIGSPVAEKDLFENITWLNQHALSRLNTYFAIQLYKRAVKAGW